MEQLRIETSPFPGRRCAWVHIYDKRVKPNDNPKTCEFVSEPNGCLCQKHELVRQFLAEDLFFDGVID